MKHRRRHTQYFWYGLLLWIVYPAAVWALLLLAMCSCTTTRRTTSETATSVTERVIRDTLRIETTRVISDTIRTADTIIIRETIRVTADTTGRELHRETIRETTRTADRAATHNGTAAAAVSRNSDATTLHTDTLSATTIVEKRPSWIQRAKDNVYTLSVIAALLAAAWYIYKRKRRK